MLINVMLVKKYYGNQTDSELGAVHKRLP